MGAGAGQRQGAGQAWGHAAMLAPAVAVHGAGDVAAALAAAGPRGVLLLSAPGAAGSLGAAWFLAMIEAGIGWAAADREVPWLAVLDCGDAPGHALAALRAGVRWLILDAGCPAFSAVAEAAAQGGATLWATRPPALDLGGLDLRRAGARRRLAAWLAAGLAPGAGDGGR